MAITEPPALALHGGSGAHETCGEWSTEAASAAELDVRLAHHRLWSVYHEVRGQLLQPRPGQVDKTVRIDRVLLPSQRLHEAGWRHGAIGIEIKRSGIRLGPPLAQAMDYTRAAWIIPEARGISVLLSMVFVWPMDPVHGPLESVLLHNRIGSASFSSWASLHLKFGSETVIEIDRAGEFRLGEGDSGHKVGSR